MWGEQYSLNNMLMMIMKKKILIGAVAFLNGLSFLDASILGALSIFLMTMLKCMNFIFSYQPRIAYVVIFSH